MNIQLTATVAAAISLLLSSGPLAAAEPQFQVPVTAQARESAELLKQTAHAFDDRLASTLAPHGTQISNLWLYPTGDRETVFAHYTLSSNEGGAAPTAHLALLTVSGDDVVRVRELSDASAELRPANAHTSGGANWAAAIGTGHASESNTDSGTTHGAPASPHWAAAIGTGSPTRSTSVQESSVPAQQSVAQAHWASKIGTGHASESKDRPTKKALAVVADTQGE
jgi:hypothetical protein